MRWVLAGVAIALVSIGSCASNPTGPGSLPLGQSFELRAGASASVEGGLSMRFDSVSSDSRCPMDAVCVWAGDATLTLRLSHRSNSPATNELHTQPSGSELVYSDYRIKLVSLSPYPRSDRRIPPGDYVATINVSVK